MGIFTALSQGDARALGARFGLVVTGARGLDAGSVNTSYELTVEGGSRVFLRIYEGASVASAEREARLLAHLAERGVPTPRPLPLASGGGSFVAEHAGKPAVVFPWIEGDVICQRGVTEAHARAVGEGLARVHLAGASFGEPLVTRFGPEDLAARLAGLRERTDAPEHVQQLLPALERQLDRLSRVSFGPTLPVIHADLFRDNVLFRDGALTALLDFESASSGAAAFDLMVTVLAWCFGDGLDRGLARALARGYSAVRALADDERAALHDAALFATLRFTITRITDYELRPRGVVAFKDYRRFVARGAALSALSARELAEMLGV
ncbi:homoserine kinase [Polyangium sorediatum]|uniref:Homoserine kinase n=1 Tax=Polyangium sorediatum TaxID=889274 RepID=A0ABT6P6N0_9BACT|nr:homoserine kinase [Polyangium sorediatum]MDI1436272.1 homoserine kinase [Polyangium sorediatum]